MAHWAHHWQGQLWQVKSSLETRLLTRSGRVKIAKHAVTGQYAAVKIVSKHALVTSRLSMTGAAETADKVLLSIEREIVIMKLIDHPNILKLYDVWETTSEL